MKYATPFVNDPVRSVFAGDSAAEPALFLNVTVDEVDERVIFSLADKAPFKVTLYKAPIITIAPRSKNAPIKFNLLFCLDLIARHRYFSYFGWNRDIGANFSLYGCRTLTTFSN